jgi:hypothetical protein
MIPYGQTNPGKGRMMMDIHEWFDLNLAAKFAEPPRADETAFESFKRHLESVIHRSESEDFRRALLEIIVQDRDEPKYLHEKIRTAFHLLTWYDDSALERLEYRINYDRVRVDCNKYEDEPAE